MHELAIVEGLIEAVAEGVQPAQVIRVRLRVGRLSGVFPHALRFCFEACSRGTALEDAALEIDEIPGSGRCRRCGAGFVMTTFLDLCSSCGSTDVDLVSGDELEIEEVETTRPERP